MELLTASPAPRKLSDNSGLGLTDPALVASIVLRQREQIASEWSAAVAPDTSTALQRLLAEALEEQLSAESAPSSPERAAPPEGEPE